MWWPHKVGPNIRENLYFIVIRIPLVGPGVQFSFSDEKQIKKYLRVKINLWFTKTQSNRRFFMNLNHTHSLSHTKWNCKYHIVFAPKYRWKVFYGSKILEIGAILRELCSWKEVNIIEAELCPDHVHMLLEIPPPKMEHIKFYRIFKRKK